MMLKFELDQKTRNIAIIFRRKDRFIGSSFFIALCAAVFIHGAALIAFKIASLHMAFPNLLLPPALVVADTSLSNYIGEKNVTSDIADRGAAKNHFPEPPLPSIALPPLAHTPLKPSLAMIQQESKEEKYFEETETRMLFALTEELAPLVSFPKTRITLSGPLGEKSIIKESIASLNETLSLPASRIEQWRLIYEVLVEDASGRIVWSSGSEMSSNKEKNQMGEEILKRIQFEKKQSAFVTPGQIEILFATQRGLE